jgi:hypothetical protein
MKKIVELVEMYVLLAKHVALVFAEIQIRVHQTVVLVEMLVLLATPVKKEFVIFLH